MLRATTTAALLILPTLAQVQERVPSLLFGVEVGAVYEIHEDGTTTLPVEKVTATQRFMGQGVHVYFKPLEEHAGFPYAEYPTEVDGALKTPYRLYLFPVLPDELSIDTTIIDWRVALIEWSDISGTDNRDGSKYGWVQNLCESITVDLDVEPEITDYYEDDWYTCTFSNSERKFEVSSFTGRTISLEMPEERFNAIDEAIERRVRQLEMEENRPYELPE